MKTWLVRWAIVLIASYCVVKGLAGLILGHAFIQVRRGRATTFEGGAAVIFSSILLAIGFALLLARDRIEEEL